MMNSYSRNKVLRETITLSHKGQTFFNPSSAYFTNGDLVAIWFMIPIN